MGEREQWETSLSRYGAVRARQMKSSEFREGAAPLCNEWGRSDRDVVLLGREW